MGLDAARAAARKAHETLYYKGLCDVYEYRDVTDDETKLTFQRETIVLQNQPCNLSFENQSITGQTDTTDKVTQGLKLFIAPEITVKAGSKIVVTQNGITGEYSSSGEPAVYRDHQEIMLKLFKDWA